MTIDPFFEEIHGTGWNACVGVQGSALNYADGYLEAARELIAAVIDKRLAGSRDTLAMPILYNCRHGLELALKLAIDRLHKMGMIGMTHPVNHDIQSHWQHLRDGEIGDARLNQLIGKLEPFVVSLAGIDEDGQELRYAANREGSRSLGNVAVVNLLLIRHSIDAMSAILEHVKLRLFDLEEERPTGTHTNECSRADLVVIASILGDHATWREASFEDKKREAMERFGLSSRKFSAAVSAIRKSRPLASLIGLESELGHLSDDKAIAALELWAKAHPIRPHDPEDLGIDYINLDAGRMREEARIACELNKAIMELLTLEEFADLEAVFYIGRGRVMGEHYQEHLSGTLKEHRAMHSRWGLVDHIMSKTDLLDSLAAGATTVGCPSLAGKLFNISRS